MNNIKALAYLLLIVAFLPICCNAQSCSYSNCTTGGDCCPCSFSINCCFTPYDYYYPNSNASGNYGLGYPYPGYGFYHPVTAVYNATGNYYYCPYPNATYYDLDGAAYNITYPYDNATGNYPYYYCPNGYCRYIIGIDSGCNNNTCANPSCINGTPNVNVICGNCANFMYSYLDCRYNNNGADIISISSLVLLKYQFLLFLFLDTK